VGATIGGLSVFELSRVVRRNVFHY
jgi:hypothetical protein